jgi:hypothetical protein
MASLSLSSVPPPPLIIYELINVRMPLYIIETHAVSFYECGYLILNGLLLFSLGVIIKEKAKFPVIED